MKLHRSLLLALAASASTLTAQQPDAPRPPDAPKPPKSTEDRPFFRDQSGAPEQKSVAYMGVLTREVPVEFRSQFGLPDGFGLMVDEVMPDSPAQTAGIKPHDILVKFADQQLVNMEQLLTLVRSKKKGDVVPFTVITGGASGIGLAYAKALAAEGALATSLDCFLINWLTLMSPISLPPQMSMSPRAVYSTPAVSVSPALIGRTSILVMALVTLSRMMALGNSV